MIGWGPPERGCGSEEGVSHGFNDSELPDAAFRSFRERWEIRDVCDGRMKNLNVRVQMQREAIRWPSNQQPGKQSSVQVDVNVHRFKLVKASRILPKGPD